MENLANLQMMLDNTMANLAAGHTEHSPAFRLRTAGDPTPYAQANPQLSNSLLGDVKLLLDVYSLALAYARQRIPAFDLEEQAVIDIVLAVYNKQEVRHGR